MRQGFALIITLSLMILLVILAVGLLTLSTVSLRSTSQETAQSEAKANARLALILALGDLQKAMGPDARISARAETLAQDKRLGAVVPSNTAKAWWVGVSNSDRDKAIGSGTSPVIWLISGLDPNSSPASQISGTFKDPVSMYGDNAIDTASLTGGEPIQAGRVMISSPRGGNAGAFAYFIDDNGMKAQLAASDSKVSNDHRPPYGGGVLPGTYDLSILENMTSLEGSPLDDYSRLLSINDLPLIGADRNIARAKRLGYTTLSLGVLSDVRKGGLKRDLTIAFEKDNVFANVFPKGSSGFDSRYIVMDAKKFSQASDLKSNGYIHWEMFKDFYNIKKSIRKVNGLDSLDTVLIDKSDIFNDNSTPFARGQLGPHAIGPNGNVPARHQQMPYGDYLVIRAPSKTDEYKHSPVIPILSRMQQNAWVDRIPAVGKIGKEMLRINVQLWTSQYNPYNINLDILGDNARFGPRIINYPQVYFTIPGVQVRNDQGNTISFSNISGFNGKRQSSVPHEILLGPGRSHVCAFKASGAKDQGLDNDEFLFDDKVRDLTLQSLYDDFEVVSGLSGKVSLTVNFVLERPSMIQGANSNSYSANHEVAQTMWAPFAWDAINNRLPGKTITKSVGVSELNENTMASLAFSLRTSREGRGAIRPLVDANIRALMCNPKWDSPLGLDLLAAYSPENRGETDEQIFQMNTRDAPKGYTYWGAGNGPPDGNDRVILFDIPREDLVSLGQLQHAGVGRFSYEPTYIVGNSYANLRIPADDWRASVRDAFSTSAHGLQDYAIQGSFNLYDASYLVNEELWDSYIFTTIPQVADNYGGGEPSPNDAYFKALLNGELLLPNPRFIPYEPPGSKFDKATLQMASGSSGTSGGFYHNAGHLLVDGSFNVNSTSVDAWEAFLSGTRKLAYQKLTANGSVGGFSAAGDVDGVRFPRVKSVLGEGMKTDSLDENFWIGFRSLEPEEVRELAEAIVKEIRKRGPFLTMGEFVNRKLETGELGQRGALQAALDATVNKDLDTDFGEKAGNSKVPADSTQGAGFPGQLQQGDILQSLSPYMTVRSDSFTIRGYGESRSPGTNEIRARAWCEATVQRYPDPVPDSSVTQSPMEALVNPAGNYGRNFRVLSFRWLSPNEI
jgi:Tfp pilus assembly protein PilX